MGDSAYFRMFCYCVVLVLINSYVIGLSANSKRLLLTDHDYMDSRFQQMEAQILNLTKQLQSLQSHVHVGQPVAFTAVLTHNEPVSSQHTVRYNNILTNVGRAYDSASGIFECPVSGIYSVSTSMMGNPNDAIHLQLVKNGKELARLWTGGGGSYELVSHTLNLNLAQHDRLWVQSINSGTVYGVENYNIFSAVLLYEGNFQ